MSKPIAVLALIVLIGLSTLGNFWFTYGIWPRSWGAFALFQVISLVLVGLLQSVSKQENA